DKQVVRMKEENLLQRRLSLCPSTTSPPKIDPRTLTRNLSYGGDNDIYNFSPGSETDRNALSVLSSELSPAQSPDSKSESRMFNGVEKDCPSPTEKLARKESLKVQKQNYRQEKKRAAKELSTALKDPSVVVMSDWLKIRGSLKSWTKLWCALRPGVLLIYKTPKTDHWVGTVLLSACKLIERPSKKDGFCFKLYHPLEKSIWAVKGPKGENVGSITQPLPSNYLIFRAASESDGRCWMDALELTLSRSSLYKMTPKAGKEGDISMTSESSHILQLLQSSSLTDTELQQ
ncbi:Oxysterol-binding protein- protein 5, partial [Characodon lateralis]|nr:Oxysterol-binding protein- protein 5 [Characodon lateralis]